MIKRPLMSIINWPNEDKPREKLLLKGEHALTDAELIAIFLNTGTRGKNALDLAKELLADHGGLKKLLQTPHFALTQKPGIGHAKYAALKAAVELGKRYAQSVLVIGETLADSHATRQYLSDRLRYHTNEVFACLFMDAHFRLISFEELFTGTVNEATIYPREIVRRGLAHNAAKIILAHNHPSGRATPSTADKEVTLLIKQSLALVDIAVVDHVIVGNPGVYSFADNEML